jgi:hypothetical protein
VSAVRVRVLFRGWERGRAPGHRSESDGTGLPLNRAAAMWHSMSVTLGRIRKLRYVTTMGHAQTGVNDR